MSDETPHIEIRGLTMAYESFVVMRDINVQVKRGEVFVIMGGSGCGKSTMLRHLIGLKEPAAGEIFYNGKSFTRADEDEREAMMHRFGVLFQGGIVEFDDPG